MADSERLRDLREQRAALTMRIQEMKRSAFAHVTVPPMQRALRALDELIAREEQASGA